MHRHSTSDSRRPAAITRHPSLVTCHFPLCILHYALCIVLAAPAAASAETALYFNGSTYFNLNRWFNALKGDLSMSAWIRVSPNIFTVNPHNTSGTAYYGAGIVGQGYYGAETGFGILANGGANTPGDTSDDGIGYQVRVKNNASADNKTLASGSYKSGTLFTGDEWHHYLVVRDTDSAKARFYVDGVLFNEMDFLKTLDLSPSRSFCIGRNFVDTAAPGGCFVGYVADLALWDEALDADDAARLMVVRPDMIGKPPYAYWPLDEGTGAKVTDKVSGAQYQKNTAGTLVWEDDPTLRRTTLAPSVGCTNGVWYATAELTHGSGVVDLLVVSPQGATNVVALSNGVATAPATFTAAIPGLAADTVYTVSTRFTDGGYVAVVEGGLFFNGPVAVAATADATPDSPGVFTVSRPVADGATNAPLQVAYTLSGTAVAGTHYTALPGTVTIPAGKSSANVNVAAIKNVAATNSLTLALAGGNYILGDPASATMSVTTVRAPAALVWSAGRTASDLADPANWTPTVSRIEKNDTLSFTADGDEPYAFTLSRDLSVKSSAFANGTAPISIDFGGHLFSNNATSGATFTQTGRGGLALQGGEIYSRQYALKTAALACTNATLSGAQWWGAPQLALTTSDAHHSFSNVLFSFASAYNQARPDVRGDNVIVDFVESQSPDNGDRHPPFQLSGSNIVFRIAGAQSSVRGSVTLSGSDNRLIASGGRFYKAGGDSYGNLSMSGARHEVVVTNTLGSACVSYMPSLGGAKNCAIRVLKGGKYSFWRIDDGLTATHSFEGCSNLVEVADGTLSLPTLRFGYLTNAAYGGNELAVRGDGAVVTVQNGCYVGNTNQPPVTLSFSPGPEGFGGNAPVRQTGTGKYIRVATNTVFKVDARALTGTRDHGRFALPLVSFRSNAEAEGAFDAEALAALNARLVSRPRGGKLSLETDGNYRILTWNYAKSSTVLLLR